MNEETPKPKKTFVQRIREEGVLPPWWGFIISTATIFAVWIVFTGWFPAMLNGFHGMCVALCIANFVVGVINALYGIIRKKFLSFAVGRDLLFMHLAAAVLVGVLFWSGHYIWALVASSFASLYNGKEYTKSETPTDSTVQ